MSTVKVIVSELKVSDLVRLTIAVSWLSFIVLYK